MIVRRSISGCGRYQQLVAGRQADRGCEVHEPWPAQQVNLFSFHAAPSITSVLHRRVLRRNDDFRQHVQE